GQSALLNAHNLDFGGADLRADLARLQQWILGSSGLQQGALSATSGASVSASGLRMPPPVSAQPGTYKSRLARPRFAMQPSQLSLLGRWAPGDKEEGGGGGGDGGGSRKEIVALWQLVSLASALP